MIKPLTKIILLMLIGITGCQLTEEKQAAIVSDQVTYQRMISLSGAITETLFALGVGDRVVGVDVTSTFPEEATALPQLGHVSQLNTEAILGLQPDLIIAESSEATNQSLQSLQLAGIKLLFVSNTHTLDSPIDMATELAETLGSTNQLQHLRKANSAGQKKLTTLLQQKQYTPKVLFIYARGKGSLMVAGRNTSAAAMIEIAGGKNAVDQFEGFKALSAEGLIEAKPDVVLLFESGLKSIGGEEGLLQIPSLSKTPAGMHRRFIAMDGLYLLGFTPRAIESAVELATRLHTFDYKENESF
ncbi:MAG: hypothetical protein DHS20C18_32390 [Saprospiraceae bacterium]|nr:MAG: hypothetical protein DHS20C18_32390 [Saprospiraceae bacterium]